MTEPTDRRLSRIVAAYDALTAAELRHPQRPSEIEAARTVLAEAIDEAAREVGEERRGPVFEPTL